MNSSIKIAVRWILTIALFIDMVDVTALNTALPPIALSLHTAPLHLKLALTSYLISLGIFIPTSSWIADRLGTRNTFAGAMLVFAIGSILCSLATSIEWLVCARIIQGMGGALMVPVGRLLMLRVYDKSELLKVTSKITMVSLIGPLVGPVMGGAIATYLNWRWIFYINVPFALLGIAVLLLCLQNDPCTERRPFDWYGFVLMGAGFALLLFGFQTIADAGLSWPHLSLILIALICLTLFIRHAKNAPHALVSPEIFKDKVSRISLLGAIPMRTGLSALPFVLPLLFQLGFGYTPLESGLSIAPLTVGAIMMKSQVQRIIGHFGFRKVLITNSLILALLTLLLSVLTLHPPVVVTLVILLCYGLALSLQYTTVNVLGTTHIPKHLVSKSNVLYNSFQQISVGFGIAVVATLLEWVAGTQALSHTLPPHIFVVAFVWVAFLITVSGLAFRRLQPDSIQKAQ